MQRYGHVTHVSSAWRIRDFSILEEAERWRIEFDDFFGRAVQHTGMLTQKKMYGIGREAALRPVLASPSPDSKGPEKRLSVGERPPPRPLDPPLHVGAKLCIIS